MDSEFFALVLMFNQSVMLHLGKMSNPATGKAEKNLVQAKMSVDILEMLVKKTKGNLDKEEEKLISNVLAEAQLNYASEAAKKDNAPKDVNAAADKKDSPEGEVKKADSPTPDKKESAESTGKEDKKQPASKEETDKN
ncbi:MAG: DUF1844 domain-containing protein [Elusimicrobiota bacterium]|nr:DUF1844 domain-containing protein [Elusimicrobiota bacterium]